MNRKNVIAAVWLIGLGLLFMVNYIWPGILILIGITMIVNATMHEEPTVMPPTDTLRQAQGKALDPLAEPVEARVAEPSTSTTTTALGESLPAVLASEAERLYLASKLPENCPACGAPMRANAKKLTWHEDNSLSCGFCGYRLTIKTD